MGLAIDRKSSASSLTNLMLRMQTDDATFYNSDTKDRVNRLQFFNHKAMEMWKQYPDVLLMETTYKCGIGSLKLLHA